MTHEGAGVESAGVEGAIPPAGPVPPPAVVARLRAAGCVFAEEEAALLVEAADDAAALDALVARRVGGEPLEQVLGWAELAGLRVRVAPGVFVPRRRTELLVRLALRALARGAAGEPPVVVDLCCGSGAAGLAVAVGARAAGRAVELHAADVDPTAVACAQGNLAGVGQVYAGDLYAALPRHLRGRVAVLVANAPYVPTAAIADMPREAREHEPAVALDGGTDGLDLHRRIAADATAWLAPGGRLLVETSRRQAAGTAAAMRAGGLAPRVVRDEDLGATAVVGVRRRA